LGHQFFSEKSDVWAWGILGFETFSGAAKPFTGHSNLKVWDMIIAGEYPMRPRRCAPEIWTTIIEPCFEKDPADRPTFQTLVTKIEKWQEEWHDLEGGSAGGGFRDLDSPHGSPRQAQPIILSQPNLYVSFGSGVETDNDEDATTRSGVEIGDAVPQVKQLSSFHPHSKGHREDGDLVKHLLTRSPSSQSSLEGLYRKPDEHEACAPPPPATMNSVAVNPFAPDTSTTDEGRVQKQASASSFYLSPNEQNTPKQLSLV
jgi:serine/threonine protein kinase